MPRKADPDWRKARLAARILLRGRAGRLTARDRRLARWLADEPGVTDRLIQQALSSLAGKAAEKARPHA